MRGTVRDSKEYPKAQNCSLPNCREPAGRVGMRDRRSRGDDCATSGRFSRWNQEQGPHPETSDSDRASEPGAWFTLKGVSAAGLWELSRFSMLNKKLFFWRVFQKNPNFKIFLVSSTAPPPADLVQCLREQISLRLVSKSKSPRGGSSARYCAPTPPFSLGARLTTRQTETDPRILFT